MSPGAPSPAASPYREANDLALGGFVDRDTFRFVRLYPQATDLVWTALTEAGQLGVWLWPCKRFEAWMGGIAVFDPGRELTLTITEFEPPRRLGLGGAIQFTLEPTGEGTRLTLDLKRPPDGWSPMALAGFHGWLGRLSRLLAGRPQPETEAWAQGIWNAAIAHCEWEVSRWVADGAKATWRIHFEDGRDALTAEGARQLDDLARLLAERGLAVTIDGFGDDDCGYGESVTLCAARVRAVSDYLTARGQPEARINLGFVLGNYHPLVERDGAAGRAFNRRIELRPVY